MPLEYENWTWLTGSVEGSSSPSPAARVVATWTAPPSAHSSPAQRVVYIAPLLGEPSEGVQVELAELRGCGSPTLLIRWSPFGWLTLHEPDKVAGLNLVWCTEATSAGAPDMAQNRPRTSPRGLSAPAGWQASCALFRAME